MTINDEPTSAYALVEPFAGLMTEVAEWRTGRGTTSRSSWDMVGKLEEAVWFMAGARYAAALNAMHGATDAEMWERRARELGWKDPE
jgi:hypothetical protein